VTDSDAAQEVLAVIERMTEALQTADADSLAAVLSERSGALHIGTDPGEWWTTQELVAGIKDATSVGDNPIHIEHDKPQVAVSGDVAWTVARARFKNDDGGERAVRVTGVFVREGGHWKAVQTHASIGVPNEKIFSTD
jgi:ketosteroid isomerase-like protein